MFFIDHDQPQVAERQEQRRPCADDQLRIPLPHHPPATAAFGHGHAGMPFGGAHPEPSLDPGQKFTGQGDFGQQYKGLSAQRQTLCHGFQIHLGFARPGDAAQQGGAIVARPDRFAQHPRPCSLIRRQVLAAIIGVKPGIGGVARGFFLGHSPLFHQPLDHRCANSCRLGQFAHGQGEATVIGKYRQHLFPRLGQPRRFDQPQPVNHAHRRRVAQPRRAGGKPQHRGHRGQGIIGDLAQKHPHVGFHRGGVQHPGHALYFRPVIIALPGPPDHTQHLARA